MSVANAGIAASATYPQAEDSKNTNPELVEPANTVEDVRPVAPDQFDPKYQAGKWEIWSYYLYYVGNNGLSLFNFGPSKLHKVTHSPV